MLMTVKVKSCRSVLLNTERKNNNYKTYKMSPHSSSSEIQTFTSPEVINECEQMLFTELICKKKRFILTKSYILIWSHKVFHFRITLTNVSVELVTQDASS